MIARRVFRLIAMGLWLSVSLLSAWLVGIDGGSAIAPEFAILLVTLQCMWICQLLGPEAYLDNFWDGYVDDVERLMDTPRFQQVPTVDMASLPIVICGCCRDVERQLPKVLASMHRIGARFKSYRIVIFENDSRDATRSLLEAEQTRFPELITLLLEDGMKSPWRTERLACIRNRLLDEARQLDPTNEGLLLMMDMDDVATKGTLAATIHTCFHFSFDSWDALTTNRRFVYYDIWALRIRQHIEFDFAEMRRKTRSMEGDLKYYLRFLRRIRKSDRLLPVLSAFAGAALYKMSALSGKHYIGLGPEGGEVCEHLSLHEQMIREGRKIYLNTLMVTA